MMDTRTLENFASCSIKRVKYVDLQKLEKKIKISKVALYSLELEARI